MVKNITLSADESIIKKARLRATKENRSFNEVFREWITRYASRDNSEFNYDTIMDSLSYANSGKKFSRDEMNER